MDKQIPLFKVHMPDCVGPVVLDTLYSGYVGEGPKVKEFEAALCKAWNLPRVLALNSGTSAIHLALHLAGVGPGDEVITTPMTCTATNMPILHAGATIVWADVDPETGEISPGDVVSKISDNTKAIIAVDWGGWTCDYDTLCLLGVPVIRDAAQSMGAIITGPEYSCFSFQAIKHITTVDGGALACASHSDHERARLLRWYGIDRNQPRADFRCEADIGEAGWKYHMNDVAATIGLAQLPFLDGILNRHRENAAFFDAELDGLWGVFLPCYDSRRQHTYWTYTIHVDKRDEFMIEMAQAGIHTSQVHARNDKHSCLKDFKNNLPGVDVFCKTQVAIPCGWWVSDEDREYIAKKIRELRG